jgi:hypothetical protein
MKGTATMSSTASENTEKVPGWYIEFQAAVLQQLPRLGNSEGQIDQVTAQGWSKNQKALKKNLADCLLPSPPVLVVQTLPPKPLLKPVGTVTILATTDKFVARDKFFRFSRDSNDRVLNEKVSLNPLDVFFTEFFLKKEGKVEDPMMEHKLYYSEVGGFSKSVPIIAKLGGEVQAETNLIEIYDLLIKQPRGEKGVLLTNRSSNVFFVRDKGGLLRVINVRWGYDGESGWDIEVNSTEHSLAGYQVFSRNPVL